MPRDNQSRLEDNLHSNSTSSLNSNPEPNSRSNLESNQSSNSTSSAEQKPQAIKSATHVAKAETPVFMQAILEDYGINDFNDLGDFTELELPELEREPESLDLPYLETADPESFELPLADILSLQSDLQAFSTPELQAVAGTEMTVGRERIKVTEKVTEEAEQGSEESSFTPADRIGDPPRTTQTWNSEQTSTPNTPNSYSNQATSNAQHPVLNSVTTERTTSGLATVQAELLATLAKIRNRDGLADFTVFDELERLAQQMGQGTTLDPEHLPKQSQERLQEQAQGQAEKQTQPKDSTTEQTNAGSLVPVTPQALERTSTPTTKQTTGQITGQTTEQTTEQATEQSPNLAQLQSGVSEQETKVTAEGVSGKEAYGEEVSREEASGGRLSDDKHDAGYLGKSNSHTESIPNETSSSTSVSSAPSTASIVSTASPRKSGKPSKSQRLDAVRKLEEAGVDSAYLRAAALLGFEPEEEMLVDSAKYQGTDIQRIQEIWDETHNNLSSSNNLDFNPETGAHGNVRGGLGRGLEGGALGEILGEALEGRALERGADSRNHLGKTSISSGQKLELGTRAEANAGSIFRGSTSGDKAKGVMRRLSIQELSQLTHSEELTPAQRAQILDAGFDVMEELIDPANTVEDTDLLIPEFRGLNSNRRKKIAQLSSAELDVEEIISKKVNQQLTFNKDIRNNYPNLYRKAKEAYCPHCNKGKRRSHAHGNIQRINHRKDGSIAIQLRCENPDCLKYFSVSSERKRLTRKDENQIIVELQYGDRTKTAIAKEFGMSLTSLYRMLERRGYDSKTCMRKDGKPNDFDSETFEDYEEKYSQGDLRIPKDI